MNFSCFVTLPRFHKPGGWALWSKQRQRKQIRHPNSLTSLPEKLCYLRLVKVIMAAWCWGVEYAPDGATMCHWCSMKRIHIWASHSMLPGDLWKDHTLRSCWFWEIEKKWSESISKLPWGCGGSRQDDLMLGWIYLHWMTFVDAGW